jgi:hypothetical protein
MRPEDYRVPKRVGEQRALCDAAEESGNTALENNPPGHYRRNDRRPVPCAPARIWILLPDMAPRLCRNEFCLKDGERRLSSGLIPGAQRPLRTAVIDVGIRKDGLSKVAALA